MMGLERVPRQLLWIGLVAVSLLVVQSAPFQNLGFDEANTNNVVDLGPLVGSTEDLLPGWEANFGATMLFDAAAAGFGYTALISKRGPVAQPYAIPVGGKYALVLSPRTAPPPEGPFIRHWISQTGDVPADAMSLRFMNVGSPFEVRVNGGILPLMYTYETGQPESWLRRADVMGDISGFAGQTVELRFTTQ